MKLAFFGFEVYVMWRVTFCGSDAARLQADDGQVSAGKVRVHTWTAATSRLANAIWMMAVAQHQFHLDCKHNKVRCNLKFITTTK